MFSMCLTCTGPLNTSFASWPPKPLSLVRNGTLCHAQMLRSCAQVCQPVVNGHACPDALSLAIAATTSGHVFGGLLGSSPAFSKASLLYQKTVVEWLKGKEGIGPLG